MLVSGVSRRREGRSGPRTYLDPVLVTLRLPNSFFAVTSQAIRELTRPNTGLRVAAIMFCLLHRRVSATGSTADEMMTPIIR